MDKISVKTILLGFLSGAIALFFAALIFNVYTGVSIYTMQTYIIPIVYGCGGGALVGYYVWKYSNLEDDIITVSRRLSKIELVLNEKNAQLCKMTHDLENVVRGRLEVEKIHEEHCIRHSAVMDSLSEGVALFEPCDGGNDFICVEMNKIGKSMTDVLGYACGKSISRIWPESSTNGIYETIKSTWDSKSPQKCSSDEYDYDGNLYNSMSFYMYTIGTGEIVIIFSDITEEKMAKIKIQELEREIEILSTQTPDTSFESIQPNLIYNELDSVSKTYYSEFNSTYPDIIESTDVKIKISE